MKGDHTVLIITLFWFLTINWGTKCSRKKKTFLKSSRKSYHSNWCSKLHRVYYSLWCYLLYNLLCSNNDFFIVFCKKSFTFWIRFKELQYSILMDLCGNDTFLETGKWVNLHQEPTDVQGCSQDSIIYAINMARRDSKS